MCRLQKNRTSVRYKCSSYADNVQLCIWSCDPVLAWLSEQFLCALMTSLAGWLKLGCFSMQPGWKQFCWALVPSRKWCQLLLASTCVQVSIYYMFWCFHDCFGCNISALWMLLLTFLLVHNAHVSNLYIAGDWRIPVCHPVWHGTCHLRFRFNHSCAQSITGQNLHTSLSQEL